MYVLPGYAKVRVSATRGQDIAIEGESAQVNALDEPGESTDGGHPKRPCQKDRDNPLSRWSNGVVAHNIPLRGNG